MLQNFKDSGHSNISMYQPLGERTIKKQRVRKDNKSLQRKYGKFSVAPPDGHLRQESVRELSTVCSQIVLKCLYLARIGRLDILWSVNKLARAVTKWTKACDKRLARVISKIHHTRECRQCCYVGNTAQQCRLGLLPDSDFARDVENSKSTSGGVLCIFGSHTFVPKCWMCEKQTSGFTQFFRI